MKKLSKLKAYTIVEVLIVVAIITALALAALTFFAPQSRKARDAKRKTDLYAIAKILEEYEKDYEIYPAALTQCGITTSGSPLDDYTTSIPCDPQTKVNYVYEVGPNATSRVWFRVYAIFENLGDDDIAQVGCSGGCGPGGAYSYFVASPNAPSIATAGVFPTLFPTPTGGPTPTSTPTSTPGGATSTPSPTPTTAPTSTPTPLPNLLANPGFESGTTGWSGIGGGRATVVSTQFHGGTNSAQIVEGAGSWRVEQTLSVVANQTYTASGWIKGGLTTGNATISILWRDAGGVPISNPLVGSTVTGMTGWVFQTSVLTAPANAATARFRIQVSNGTTGMAWFDDLALY